MIAHSSGRIIYAPYCVLCSDEGLFGKLHLHCPASPCAAPCMHIHVRASKAHSISTSEASTPSRCPLHPRPSAQLPSSRILHLNLQLAWGLRHTWLGYVFDGCWSQMGTYQPTPRFPVRSGNRGVVAEYTLACATLRICNICILSERLFKLWKIALNIHILRFIHPLSLDQTTSQYFP